MSRTLPLVGRWLAVSSGILAFLPLAGVGTLGAQQLALKRHSPGDGAFNCPVIQAGTGPTEEERTEFNHGTPMATSKYATAEKGRQVLDYLIMRCVEAVESIRNRKVTLRYVDVIPM